MHFLLSNDDGIHAPGLQALARRLAREAMVSVVAPDRERSATSQAITVYHPLRCRQVDDYGPQIRAYAVDGTPADCVRLGLEALLEDLPPCDAVISGINYGVNLGTDVLYSGTVGAAMEAVVIGVPALAVSLAQGEFSAARWEKAAEVATHLALQVAKRGLPVDTLLNINVPNLPAEQVGEAKITRLGIRRYKDGVHKRRDPWGQSYYWRAGKPVDSDTGEQTDAHALATGHISISPVHFDMTHYDSMQYLESWLTD